ncbi:hydroxymethylbilane synthase [Flammeovirgaceae bacterium SG7u.111]|nr:hydroxymethylbilane synthase [Flammeovirgaceae bacterium SG7u.132]WPO36374.1 hydroxymethylbilane synthase [Flammeovirgaceae bacterium SG7u.111]
MSEIKIKIGTRGSKLALWQAYYVEELLQKSGLETEIITIETKGDKILDRTLAKIGSKGVFTEELEDQLISGDIDIAVHSAKDVQSSLAEGFELIAFSKREKIHDVLVSKTTSFNPEKPLTLGTSSVRRVAMLKKYLPNMKVVDVRGNLQTRIKKMEDGLCDALVLAYAGVHRMGYEEMVIHEFPTNNFIPAVGQGTVAIEAHTNLSTEAKEAIRKAINHTETEFQLLAERAFLRKLEGGCSIPAFALAQTDMETKRISITGGLIATDGSQLIQNTFEGTLEEAADIGEKLANYVLENGGVELLAEIKGNK